MLSTENSQNMIFFGGSREYVISPEDIREYSSLMQIATNLLSTEDNKEYVVYQ